MTRSARIDKQHFWEWLCDQYSCDEPFSTTMITSAYRREGYLTGVLNHTLKVRQVLRRLERETPDLVCLGGSQRGLQWMLPSRRGEE